MPSLSLSGLGTDIVAIDRIAQLGARFGERFYHKILTPHERAYCRARAHPDAACAKRYAAKEALFKAMGTGLRAGLSWQDVEIRNTTLGAPVMVLSPALHQRLHQYYGYPVTAMVSLSDERYGGEGYALAFVVLIADSAATYGNS